MSLCVDATEVAAAANPVFWQEDGSCMSGNGFLRLLFRPEIRRHGDVGKKPPFVTRVASRAHPLAGCRGAAAETERSEGKGREHEGGNVRITFYFFTFAECQKSKAGSYTYRYAYRVQTENKQKDV